METTQNCPRCRQPLPANAPEGLCPACLAKVALGADSAAPGPTVTAIPLANAPGTGTRVPPAPAQLAAQFPQLEIVELIGMGGMGMVYKARQTRLDRLVALKILPTNPQRQPGFAERFSREAKALAKLDHPGIVSVYDFGQTAEYYYFIMEHVDGMNLRQLLGGGGLEPRQALELVAQICGALQFAHDEGVVHRDIKPENILINKKGRVKIADFGLAKLLGSAPDTALTMSQATMGTINYMAPEQRENAQKVDHRADIYSLGVVFYEMLTGEVPMGRFDAPSKKVQVDVRLDEVVLRALEREPARRYQQASEVQSGVEAVTSGGGGGPPKPAAPSGMSSGGSGAPLPRLSRMAVAGAVWAPFFLLAFGYLTVSFRRIGPGVEQAGPAWWQIGLAIILFPLALSAPFGTTILGCMALPRIRRSAGRLCGLGLALFDALLYPLLALNGLIVWALYSVGVAARSLVYGDQAGAHSINWIIPVALLISLGMSGLLSWLAWRAANNPHSGRA
jgi:hypothetical protein